MTQLFFVSKEYFWKTRREFGLFILPPLKVLGIWSFACFVTLIAPFYALGEGIELWIIWSIIRWVGQATKTVLKVVREPVFTSFFATKKYFWTAYGRGTLLLTLIFVNVWVNSMFAQSLGEFGEILQQQNGRTFSEFNTQILWIIVFVFNNAFLQPIQTKHTQMFTLGWRKAITFYFVPLLGKIIGKGKIYGISQRIQEEPSKFADFLETFVVQIISAILSLFVFLPQLWSISPMLHIGAIKIDALGIFFEYPIGMDIPGSLVIIVILVGIFGMWNSLRMGKPFPALVIDNRNADTVNFREHLVGVELGTIAFNPKKIEEYFDVVYKSYSKRYQKYVLFNLWMSTYWGAIVILPLYIMGNGIIAGIAMYTALAQVTYIFGQSIANFSVFTNNWGRIVDFKATYERLNELDIAINNADNLEEIAKDEKQEDSSSNAFLVCNGVNTPITKEELALVLEQIRKRSV